MKRILIALLTSLAAVVLSAQDSTTAHAGGGSINLFLDCTSCDGNYLAEHLTVANFVTEPAAADVHLIVTRISSGNGSAATSMVFAGRKRFFALRDTIVFNMAPEMTLEETRLLYLEKIQLGLVPFLMKTAAAGRLMLLIGDGFLFEDGTGLQKDPWRDWMFELNGMGSMINQKSYQTYNLNLGLNVSRITGKFKLESYSYLDYNESRISYSYFDPDAYADTTIHYNICQRGFHSSNLLVASVGKHFGLGGVALVKSDHPNNLGLRAQAGPAIEYNVFPYKESLQKQFRIMYSVLYEHNEYLEPTIFDKMIDDGWKQNLRIMARFSNTWGYLDAAVAGSSYLHDPEKYSLGASMYGDIRVFKGVSVNFMCGLSMYRDRINQPKGIASLDEILSSQKEMATDYQYNFRFGVSYRFGSKKLPPVNPRFSY